MKSDGLAYSKDLGSYPNAALGQTTTHSYRPHRLAFCSLLLLTHRMEVCSIQSDAGRPCFHHRHRRDNHRPHGTYPAHISPTRSPYPLPYHHPSSKTPFLDGQPSTATTDDPLVASESSPSLRHLRHSLPDVIYKHGPRVPSSSSPLHTGAIYGARARFVSLPAVISSFPGIDTECDRLERACGRAPPTAVFLRTRGGSGDNDLPPSSPHQPRRGDDGGPPPPLAPKWSHWELVLRIKRVLRNDGKDIRDYVEAGQIDQLYHQDIEERARREQERARMAKMRTGQELSDSDDNTRSCFLSCHYIGFIWADTLVTCRHIWSPVERERAPSLCHCHPRWLQA
jgi:hypothetical protein